MRKALDFKLLYSISLFLTLGNCSRDKDPDPKFVTDNNKCTLAVKNMLEFLDGILGPKDSKGSKDFAGLRSLKFIKLFLDELNARGESEKSKNSVEKNLTRLFTPTNPNFKGINIIEEMRKLSDAINRDQSTSPLVFIGNTNDKSNFSIMGKSFISKGIEYALIVFTESGAKFFFSYSDSTNNFLIDEHGNTFDKKKCLKSLERLGNNIQCIVVPIVRLELKPKTCFVHLGGFNWETLSALPTFFSLIAAKAYERMHSSTAKSKGEAIQSRLFIYFNDKDDAAWGSGNVVSSHFFQSMGVSANYSSVTLNKIKNPGIIDSGINYVKLNNGEFIVLSSRPHSTHLQLNKSWEFIDLLETIIKNVSKNLDPGQNSDRDIFLDVFLHLKEANEKRIKFQGEKEQIENAIKSLKQPGNPQQLQNLQQQLNQKNIALRGVATLTDKSLKVTSICIGNSGQQHNTIDYQNDYQTCALDSIILSPVEPVSMYLNQGRLINC